jgi:hypothetical protein
LKGILPGNHSFQGGERLILFQIGLFSKIEETHISLKIKTSVLEAGASCTQFPCKNRCFVKDILPVIYVFQGEYRLSWLQIFLFCQVEETHATLQKKQSVSEAAVSCTLFPYENWVCF